MSGDPDVFVSQPPYDRPVLTNHTWAATHAGSDRLVITLPANPPAHPPSNTVHVGVTGYGGPASFTIDAAVAPDTDVDMGGGGGTGVVLSAAPDGDTPACPHCGKAVPAASFDRHTAFCARNNVRCPVAGCGKTIRRGEEDAHTHCDGCDLISTRADVDKHKKVWHTEVACPCGLTLRLRQLVRHTRTECERRVILCRFCGGPHPAGRPGEEEDDVTLGLCGHESYCGSRTRTCPVCGKRMALKKLRMHGLLEHPDVDTERIVESSLDTDAAVA